MQIQMVLRVAGARLPSPPLLLLCSYSWTLNVVFYYLDDLETQKTISSRKKKMCSLSVGVLLIFLCFIHMASS